MKVAFVLLCLMSLVEVAFAQDRIVITHVSGLPMPGRKSTNAPPKTIMLADPKFKAIQKDVEEVIGLLGGQTEWSDFGPDTGYVSAEIHYRKKQYVINSWYPLFRDKPNVAVSETRGLVGASGLAEKQQIENGNSRKYQTIVRLLEKAEAISDQGDSSKTDSSGQ
jgi:hypothetical protein